MTMFNINLARGHVFSLKKRQWINRIFLVYLLACGLLLILMCNRAVSNLVFAHDQEVRIKNLQSKFAETHSGDMAIRAYHDQILTKLKRCEKQLTLLDEKIQRHQPVSQVLVELIEPLPAGVAINEATYQQKSKLLQFSVIIPRGDNQNSVTSDQLIMQWKKQPLIRTEVDSITAVYSDRTIVHEREVYVVQFRCILKEKV